ncbi:hypothetical protein KVE54_04735 [Helicobacter pylori]|nr:hypothetical protein KVE54_04735 [Helicobacter pylori]
MIGFHEREKIFFRIQEYIREIEQHLETLYNGCPTDKQQELKIRISGLEHGIQALFKDTLRREELWLCNDQYMVNINIACVSVFKRTPTYLSKEQNPRGYDLEIIALCVRK